MSGKGGLMKKVSQALSSVGIKAPWKVRASLPVQACPKAQRFVRRRALAAASLCDPLSLSLGFLLGL